MSTIRTVDRTFSILQLVAQHPQGIGVTAIAEDLSLAKSTVSRLLSTMQSWGVVERTANQRFRIGPEPARWVRQQERGQTLVQRFQPILHAIAAETQEATALCVLDGNELLYLKNLQSNQNIQMRDWQGERLPPHTVSPGKLLLAYGGKEAVERYLATPLLALTTKTVTDPQILRAQLTAIRGNGFSIANEEFGEGIVGMAVPVVDKPRASSGSEPELAAEEVVAAICVYGPKYRLSSLGKQMNIIKVMQAATP